ncbi:MAG: hypothetical protein H7X86_02090 [Gorillibacterium sp.]|nr:hypothetical protein [Gorillibacterium sp.]
MINNYDIGWSLQITEPEGISVETGGQEGWLEMPLPDLSGKAYLLLELTGSGSAQFSFALEFYSSAKGWEQGSPADFDCKLSILPGLRVRVAFPLSMLDAQRLKLERTPGLLKGFMSGRALCPTKVSRLRLSCPKGTSPFILHTVEAVLEQPDCSLAKPKPLVDERGQLLIKNWPGRVNSTEDLVKALREEAERRIQLNKSGVEKPSSVGLSRFGGYLERPFKPTGFFRTEKDDSRWWLVDPDGFGFYSTGLDVVSPGEAGRIEGLEKCLQWLPDRSGEFSDAYREGEVFPPDTYFNYSVANLIRAFGGEWWKAWAQLTKSRMEEWGFNTVGNWSDPRYCAWSRTPYVFPMDGFPVTDYRIFRDFPDVYHESYAERSILFAEQLKTFRGDPYLIGYFMTNEPSWAFAGRINLAREMFREPQRPLASKQEFIHYLRDIYGNEPEGLAAAWGMQLESFEQVLTFAYEDFPDGAEADLFGFTRVLVERYIQIPAEAARRVDMEHLNLGMRYAWVSSELVFCGQEYLDVFSINCYKLCPKPEDIELIKVHTGKPVLIGEFHFGAPDVGLMSCGLKSVTSQEERGKAYQYYVEQAASMDSIVGTHYFILNDQAGLGRFDGEAFQIGVVDVCHRPYEPFVEGIQAAHRNLFAVLTGKAPPYSDEPKEWNKDGF